MESLIVFVNIVAVIGMLVILSVFLYKSHKEKSVIKISYKEALDLTELPVITLHSNNRKVNFLIDTGSNLSYIDSNILKDLDHEITGNTKSISGLGGHTDNGIGAVVNFKYHDHTLTDNFFTLPLEDTFRAVKEESGVTIHGILGTSFFTKYKSIINYETSKIICKKK